MLRCLLICCCFSGFVIYVMYVLRFGVCGGFVMFCGCYLVNFYVLRGFVELLVLVYVLIAW